MADRVMIRKILVVTPVLVVPGSRVAGRAVVRTGHATHGVVALAAEMAAAVAAGENRLILKRSCAVVRSNCAA